MRILRRLHDVAISVQFLRAEIPQNGNSALEHITVSSIISTYNAHDWTSTSLQKPHNQHKPMCTDECVRSECMIAGGQVP